MISPSFLRASTNPFTTSGFDSVIVLPISAWVAIAFKILRIILPDRVLGKASENIMISGRTAGPATPNLQAQKEVLQTALTKSGKKPEEISYIDVNGSGSEVTDLLELKAIQSIYRSSNTVPLGLGSMKPNIGHPLCAEGIASFIKVVLMLQHRQWVPFLSGEQPMTHYDMESSPFYFCRKLTEWTNTPRISAINCFADGGTNAHVILESWEDQTSHSIIRHPIPPPELDRQQIQQNGFTMLPDKSKTHDFQVNDGIVEKMIWETFK